MSIRSMIIRHLIPSLMGAVVAVVVRRSRFVAEGVIFLLKVALIF